MVNPSHDIENTHLAIIPHEAGLKENMANENSRYKTKRMIADSIMYFIYTNIIYFYYKIIQDFGCGMLCLL